MTRVLIVDDNTQNLYLLRSLLQGHGHAVDEARDGGQALWQARREPPGLVVSDLLMPGMDGYTLLRQWKADEQLRGIPFIVYTATYTEPRDERLALSLGADAFVVKPADPEALMTRIDAVLARLARGAAVATAEAPADPAQLLADYNEVLVRKLEKRALQLETANRELQSRIEDLQRAESARQDSEERFRATFEQAAVGIAHVGVDGRLLRVNDKLCSLTGRHRDALLECRLPDLTTPEDRADAERELQALLAGELRDAASERRYSRQGGAPFWGSLVATLLRDAAGAPKYVIAVVTDVSERRQLQEQFRQAQKLETIGQLTGGIAHDFNNLLTVIIGNSELLAEGLAADDALRPLAEMSRNAASRGADLTQRLLAFARRQALSPRAVDVNRLLQGMQSMLRRMLPADIVVELEEGDPVPPARVDPAQLEAALLNLAINARDAMPDGGRLRFETGLATPEEAASAAASGGGAAAGPCICIAVSDSGSGIAPEHLSQVFEPFFTTKPAGKGTGLGLSMVYGFVKQSHGHVGLQSDAGRGTTVRLVLPPAGPQDQAAVLPAAPVPAAGQADECILLVEDDELVRRYAQALLTQLGYRVIAAADGVAALQIVKDRDDIDLLFTDVVMPGGINGLQLADAALALRPALKVLLCSGYADDAIVDPGRLQRGMQLLAKPYGRTELANRLRAVLAAAPAPVPDPAAGPGSGRLLVLDDDPTVGYILCMSAERLGFQARQSEAALAFYDQVRRWRPSHLAIDLSLPEMASGEVLERLAGFGCRAQVIVYSGAGIDAMNQRLDQARGLGLPVAGMLPKPFTVAMLRLLLSPDSGPAAADPR